MNKEEKETVVKIEALYKYLDVWKENYTVVPEDKRYFKTILNLIQKQEKIIDKATEILEEAKLSYFTKEDGGELIGQYRCFNKDDWKKYLKKEVEKDVKD